jgi:amino acid adenylation domain-containing protein
VSQTLGDLLRATAANPAAAAIVHVRSDGSEQIWSYQELYQQAQSLAQQLSQHIPARSPLLLALESSEHFLPAFWAAILADLVPVPLAPEPERIHAIWQALDQASALIDPNLVADSQIPANNSHSFSCGTLLLGRSNASLAHEIAYLQYSSGSTGSPRGVELSHSALIANVHQIAAGCQTVEHDVMISWMPYYHDMGLIATHLMPLALGIKQVKIDPLHFARRPSIWFAKTQQHAGSLLTAAPFALELVTQRISAAQFADYDLRSVRVLGIGAEPIAPSICRAFAELAAHGGLNPNALTPVYGLAEACVGVSISPPNRGLQSIRLDRQALEQGRVVLADDGIELCSVGSGLPDCQIRIVDEHDNHLPEGQIGHIQVLGPQLMRGYHRVADPEASFCDGWLRTGDLGLLLHGNLYITGRAKELIIVNGRNHYAPDLEEQLRRVPKLKLGRVAVSSIANPNTGRETVLAFLGLRAGKWQGNENALRQAQARIRAQIGSPDVVLIPLSARDFPRTTSGKLQRLRLRERYAASEFAEQVEQLQVALQSETSTALASEPIALPDAPTLEQQLGEILSRILGYRVEPQQSLNDLGATSVQQMQFLAAIGERFAIEPDPAALRQNSSISALAGWMRSQKQTQQNPPRSANFPQQEPIAVLSMACRFPQADSPEKFWRLLCEKRDLVLQLPSVRRDGRPAPSHGFSSLLDEIERFDAAAFGISEAEAAMLDPQQRILLELAYEALERANYAGSRRQQVRIGVFMAVGESGYQELMMTALRNGMPATASSAVGTMRNLQAARIANALNLNGPAIAIDTACSSGLVALHVAQQSIARGECDLALVGGANLLLSDTPLQLLQSAGALSPSGRSRAFDAQADGFAAGEGAGMLLLGRQSEQQPALALIRSSAINNDGTALSPMAPNPHRQAEVIALAYQQANLDSASVSYIEAHGTGTPIGDPIEARSLMQSLAPAQRYLGSVKTNLGHLLNAAAIPALIKVVLMLQHKQIPPSLHYQQANPRFHLSAAGFQINSELVAWQSETPRRAAINSFGFGGTNAHVVLEEAPELKPQVCDQSSYRILPLSAPTSAQLEHLALRWAAALPDNLAALCAAAGLRQAWPARAALVLGPQAAQANAPNAALQALAERLPAHMCVQGYATIRRRVVWMFAGQGAQYPGQGRELYQHEPIFRQSIDEATQILGPIHGRTLSEWMLDDAVSANDLEQTQIAQPLLVAFAVSLARLLRHWGLQPDALIGHSVGEIAAACVAGALSYADALRFAAERGRLMHEQCAAGEMAVVFAPAEQIQHLLRDQVAIAAINAPSQTTIAGPSAQLARVLEDISRDGFSAMPLNSRYAFHSPLVEPIRDALRNSATQYQWNKPELPILSTATGEWLHAFTSDYWADQARQAVLFAAAVNSLLEQGFDSFVELGPSSTLSALVRQIPRPADTLAESLLRRGDNDQLSLRSALARLWVAGIDLDFAAINGAAQPCQLPTTPWADTRYWLPETSSASLALTRPLRAELPSEVQLGGITLRQIELEPKDQRWTLRLFPSDGAAPLELANLDFREIAHESKQALRLLTPRWQPKPAAGQGTITRWQIVAGADQAWADQLATAIKQRGWQSVSQADAPSDGVIVLTDGAGDAPFWHLWQYARNLANQAVRPAVVLVVTRNGIVTGVGREQISADQALVAGLAKALPEQGLQSAWVQLDLSTADSPAQQLEAVLSECTQAAESRQIAWRNGQRLAMQVAELDAKPQTMPSGQHIVILGGAGGVGRQLSQSLLAKGMRISVLGRRPESELEPLAAGIQYRQADLNNASSLRQALQNVQQEVGTIDGVIHAAGDLELGSIHSKDAQRVQELIAAKVQGSKNLLAALAELPQRPWIWLCSSVAALQTGLAGGLAEYVAANSFLDGLAAAERLAGHRVLSINWPPWPQHGMAQQRGSYDLGGLNAFDPQALDQTLDLLFGCEQAQVLPQTAAPIVEQLALPVRVAQQFSASELEQILRDLLARTLNKPAESLPLDMPFLNLGLDSLQAVDLVKKLEQILGSSLPLTLFFEFQSIEALAKHLAQQTPQNQAPSEPDEQPSEQFALSAPQLAFYAGQQLYPERGALTLFQQQIIGKLDAERLGQAMQLLLERHAMLRAQFVPMDEQNPVPMQQILPVDALPRSQWFALAEPQQDPKDLLEELLRWPFDLHQAPLFRLVLWQNGEQNRLFVLVHHAIADGWSIGLLVRELWMGYTALSQGKKPDLPPNAEFSQYIALQQSAERQIQREQDKRWWAEQFAQHRQALDWALPSSAGSDQLARMSLRIDAQQSQALRQIAAQHGVSLFHLLIAAYARSLQACQATQSLAINVAEHGRSLRLAQIENMLGCCADQLPLLLNLPTSSSVIELAVQIRERWNSVQQHNSVSSFDLAQLMPTRQGGVRTAGAATFSFARFEQDAPEQLGLAFGDLDVFAASAATRLTLLAWERAGALEFRWHYPAGSLKPALSEKLRTDFVTSLEKILHPTAEKLEFMPPADPLVIERILTHCQSQPQAIAIRYQGREVSYGELGQLAARLAQWLGQHGVQHQQPVGLLTLPGIATICGIVGILSAGSPWLALNSEYPTKRLAEMAEEANVRVVLYQQETAEHAARLQAELPHVRLLAADAIPELDAPWPQPQLTPEDLAYIIFTSGSTGKPKGVPVTHRAIANYVTWLIETFEYTPNDRLLQAAAISFGAAVSQILGPLCSGGMLIPLPASIVRDPAELLALFEREQPTIWRSVPSLWERLLSQIEQRVRAGQPAPALPALRWIGVGGEPLPPSVVRRWMALYGAQHGIVNHYGPSEATINATYYIVPSEPSADTTRIPIGKALRNTTVHIIDEDGQPCAVGEQGLLFIGGVCLSPGYLNRPDLTAERFIQHPQFGRIYNTGDLARELPDGNLVFVGRADDQIKIRGYRVEPGEIEATLLQHPAIARVAVCALGDDEHTELVAFCETQQSLPSDVELRRWLGQWLPQHMLPHRFVALPVLPTNPAGKIDRPRLRAWQAPVVVAPAPTLDHFNQTEQLLYDAWSAVLQRKDIRREDNFFELGGDSLLILRVLALLKPKIKVKLSAAQIYQHHSLGELAAAIDAQSEQASAPQTLVVTQALAPAQTGFVLLERIAPDAPTSWCTRLNVHGTLDVAALQQALQFLQQRHQMLRMRFVDDGATVRQELVANAPALRAEVLDLQPHIAAGADEQALVNDLYRAAQQQRLSYRDWPLLRMQVLSTAPNSSTWLIQSHHIIGDAWSAWLFGQELLACYDALVSGQTPQLEPISTSFAEYVSLLQQQQADPSHSAFWRAQFAEPYQAPQGWQRTSNMAQLDAQLTLTGENFGKLRRLAAEAGTTLYVLLLTAFARQVRRLTNSADVVLGTALAGRDLPLADIERIFGCCASALPLRVRGAQGSFGEDLRRMAQLFSESYAHALPPAQIAKEFAGKTSALHATGSQFFFSFADFSALGDLRSEHLAIDWDEANSALNTPSQGTDLLLVARPLEQGLRLQVQASPKAFDEQLLAQFVKGLERELLGDPDKPSGGTQFSERALSTSEFGTLDAALIGYLPSSQDLARMTGWQGEISTVREQLRQWLFPQRKPLWAELLETPLGRSGFVCLPWFADELHASKSAQLVEDALQGITLAQQLGARSISLAGMLPSLTGYGYAVQQRLPADAPKLTSGHASTVVAVVQTVRAALQATQRRIEDCHVAVLGLGSIGQASLRLLLSKVGHPASLLLCDGIGSSARVHDFAASLGYQGQIRVLEADGQAPAAMYQADVLIGASSAPNVLDATRLRSGSIVVDDSFPPCIEPQAALRRMREQGDVLISGGGLLSTGTSLRTVHVPLPDPRLRERVLRELPANATASCQIESLIVAKQPDLPATLGLVSDAQAERFWQTLEQFGLSTPPLHWQGFQPDAAFFAKLIGLGKP